MKNTTNGMSISADSDGTLIRMRNIDKVFKTASGEVRVLKNINLDIRKGEFISVVGRSGSGKSTLINMLTGIDHPTRGSVQAGQVNIHQLGESEMSTWRGHNLGIVFQFFQLLPMLTLLENVMLPMDFCNVYPASKREERALQLLDLVGLAALAYKKPGMISGGQQQSAAVARALANDPPILIADEPTGNLDSRTARQVMQLFQNLHESGKTIIMVTHDQNLAKQAERVLAISDGELVHEVLYKSFPHLPHTDLLKLAHMARVQRFAEGSPVHMDEKEGNLFLVTGGQMEIHAPQGVVANKHPAALLRAGKWFTLQNVLKVQQLNGSLRAAAGFGLEVFAFDRAEVEAFLGSVNKHDRKVT